MLLNDEIIGAMLSNAHAAARRRDNAEPSRNDITEEEALRIFNEIVDIFKKHNVTYQCACRLAIALSEAFITGAVELYAQEQ